MELRRLIFVILMCFCPAREVLAQVSIDFIPEISGNTLDGLMNVRITNIGGKKTIKLEITVNFVDEVSSVQMVRILTQPFDINSGSNMVPPSIIRSADVKIGTSEPSKFLQRNGYFPAGEYSYDFKVILVSTQEVLLEQNFYHYLQPPAPLNLVEPYDKDEICEPRPLLSWQPHFPMTAGTQYQVVLTEIKEKQKAVEALQYNLPMINQKGIVANLMMYPAVARDLEKGKKYAWQVTAYQGTTVLNRSEIWEFNMKCQDTTEEKKIETDLGYRLIEDLSKGNNYITSGLLKVAIVNAYGPQLLRYEISCLTDPKLKFRNLPAVQLLQGRNNIMLDLTKQRSLMNNFTYVLKVQLPNGSVKQLRFIYKE